MAVIVADPANCRFHRLRLEGRFLGTPLGLPCLQHLQSMLEPQQSFVERCAVSRQRHNCRLQGRQTTSQLQVMVELRARTQALELMRGAWSQTPFHSLRFLHQQPYASFLHSELLLPYPPLVLLLVSFAVGSQDSSEFLALNAGFAVADHYFHAFPPLKATTGACLERRWVLQVSEKCLGESRKGTAQGEGGRRGR